MIDFACMVLAGTLYLADTEGATVIQLGYVSKHPDHYSLYVADGLRHMFLTVPEEHEIYTMNGIEFIRWCERDAAERNR